MKSHKILIVDDSPQFIQSVIGLVQSVEGLEIAGTASSVNEGVRKAVEVFPDLILMDLILPDGTGIDAARQIKKVLPNIPVVILSIYDLNDYREAAERVGVLDFIPKSELRVDRLLSWLSLASAPKAQYRFLVIDDSPTIRRMIIRALQPIEADFDEASNGLEALEKLTISQYDLVTLDLNMPDMHGYEVLQFIRQTQRLRNIPVLVLTTRGDEDSLQKALSLGANRYLVKPFTPSVLLDAVQELLR